MKIRRCFFTYLLLWVLCGTLVAQNDPDPAPPPEAMTFEPLPEDLSDSRQAETLASLYEAVRIKQAEHDRLNTELASQSNEIGRAQILEQLENVSGELSTLRARFNQTAAGVDLGEFEDKPKEKFSWEQKLWDVFQPIAEVLEDATAESRKIGNLRKELEIFSEQEELARKGIANVEALLELVENQPLKEALQKNLQRLQDRGEPRRKSKEFRPLAIGGVGESANGSARGVHSFCSRIHAPERFESVVGARRGGHGLFRCTLGALLGP